MSVTIQEIQETFSVSVDEITEDIIIQHVYPKGDKGEPGEPGAPGADGQDGLDANVTQANITSALGYTPADANNLHAHSNKAVIDKFGEDVNGDPTYNGIKVDTTIAQRDVYDGLDSLDNTISLSANQGKVLNDKIGDINTALDTINGQII